MKHVDYELLSAREMSRKYGLTAENRPVIALNAASVPEERWSTRWNSKTSPPKRLR
jgi:hypothetical protein